jgi:hypothetical protein
VENEIQGCNVIGRLGGKFEHTLDLTRRVYDVNAVAPTITTCGGVIQNLKLWKSTHFLTR